MYLRSRSTGSHRTRHPGEQLIPGEPLVADVVLRSQAPSPVHQLPQQVVLRQERSTNQPSQAVPGGQGSHRPLRDAIYGSSICPAMVSRARLACSS